MRRDVALAAVLLLAGCGGPATAPPSVAQLPPGLFSGPDTDIAAMGFAQAAFSDPARTYGNPADGAEAVIALEYLAGAVATSPRWTTVVDPMTMSQLLEARAALRQAVGILPGASSQLVVDRLVVARNALANGDGPGAAAALSGAPFSQDGAAVAKALANLPYVRLANVATSQADQEMTAPPAGSDTFIPQ